MVTKGSPHAGVSGSPAGAVAPAPATQETPASKPRRRKSVDGPKRPPASRLLPVTPKLCPACGRPLWVGDASDLNVNQMFRCDARPVTRIEEALAQMHAVPVFIVWQVAPERWAFWDHTVDDCRQGLAAGRPHPDVYRRHTCPTRYLPAFERETHDEPAPPGTTRTDQSREAESDDVPPF